MAGYMAEYIKRRNNYKKKKKTSKYNRTSKLFSVAPPRERKPHMMIETMSSAELKELADAGNLPEGWRWDPLTETATSAAEQPLSELDVEGTPYFRQDVERVPEEEGTLKRYLQKIVPGGKTGTETKLAAREGAKTASEYRDEAGELESKVADYIYGIQQEGPAFEIPDNVGIMKEAPPIEAMGDVGDIVEEISEADLPEGLASEDKVNQYVKQISQDLINKDVMSKADMEAIIANPNFPADKKRYLKNYLDQWKLKQGLIGKEDLTTSKPIYKATRGGFEYQGETE